MTLLYTIGHSNRSFDEFAGILIAHGVKQVADVRTIPRSRHNPQFNAEALERDLAERSIGYRHFPDLGGLRKPRADSPNTYWRNASFRGYADYMATDRFRQAIDALVEYGSAAPTAIMCAEAVWWRCHRSLIADFLVALRGVAVHHLVSAAAPSPHEVSGAAQVSGGRIVYQGLKGLRDEED